jgi:hypothetical protein
MTSPLPELSACIFIVTYSVAIVFMYNPKLRTRQNTIATEYVTMNMQAESSGSRNQVATQISWPRSAISPRDLSGQQIFWCYTGSYVGGVK